MYRLRTELCLLFGVASLAGCSDRNALTAPSARPLASAAALVDRPYTWSFKCNGDGFILAEWSWTENGIVLASSSAGCTGSGQVNGTGVRPATASGFTATVWDNSKSWTFDPAGPFKASLSGSDGGHTRKCHDLCGQKESGQLSVDS
jgi:hypothetical protein